MDSCINDFKELSDGILIAVQCTKTIPNFLFQELSGRVTLAFGEKIKEKNKKSHLEHTGSGLDGKPYV